MTTLTALDRCDRCGAQAALVVEYEAGDLLFCQHHARQYGFAVVTNKTTTEAR